MKNDLFFLFFIIEVYTCITPKTKDYIDDINNKNLSQAILDKLSSLEKVLAKPALTNNNTLNNENNQCNGNGIFNK